MKRENKTLAIGVVAAALAGACGSAAMGQSWAPLPTGKHTWSENAGFMNWLDGTDGQATLVARIDQPSPQPLRGSIWCENIGWVQLGSLSWTDHPLLPAYTNTNGTNWGVNASETDFVGTPAALSGYAWGENVGWINFSGGALANPPQPARVLNCGKLTGYAWGENIGWINLDGIRLAGACRADHNCSGSVSVQDIFDFLTDYFASDPEADYNSSGTVTVQDIFDFLTGYFSGCG